MPKKRFHSSPAFMIHRNSLLDFAEFMYQTIKKSYGIKDGETKVVDIDAYDKGGLEMIKAFQRRIYAQEYREVMQRKRKYIRRMQKSH